MTPRNIVAAIGITAGLPWMPAVAHAQDPPAESTQSIGAPLTITLEVDTDKVPDELDSQVADLIQAEAETLGQQHGFVFEGSDRPDLSMRIAVSQPEGQSSVFLITSSVEFEGATISSATEDVCLRCTAKDVAMESLSILPGAVAHARDARAEAARPPLPAPPADEACDAGVLEEPAPALGPVAYVGIGAGALGLGATIAGAVLLSRGKISTDALGGPSVDSIDYRPPGAALVGVGLGALVIGKVLLALDLSVLRERRTKARAELTGIGLRAHDGPGLTIHGRF
ncbi:hypothetical protein ENSA5_11050 [Enhygromyxa salina]|uniref:Uncharacterized protein n=1 Tax=Enhygromyxa salina TaxID=215803 RepID=A0A2S9YG25_9BACT|nr:hypothetical protein [Enhygromyxa salina]PRQ04057.1 hypothetical protein ENSA5_11050 [Enhygromyxa salina]